MRLFVYNNNQFKYLFKKKYLNTYNNLYDVFGSMIEQDVIKHDARKKVLWATAFKTLKAVTFEGSKVDFVNENGYERTVGNPDIRFPNGQNGYDFYLDRGTGWCALAKNYSIYREINSKGNVPDKHTYITEAKTPPWLDFTEKFWGITFSDSSEFLQNLATGESTIIPFGVANFYGTDQALTKDNFQNLARVTANIADTIRAVIMVEWPAVAYDSSFFVQLTSVPTISQSQKRQALFEYQYLYKRIDPSADPPAQFERPDPAHLGASRYLGKLQLLEKYLVVVYRQMRMLTTSYHFDSESIDLNWYQTIASGILYTFGATCRLIATIVGGFSASGIVGFPVGGKVNYAIGTPGKELFTLFADFFEKKQALYKMGGKPEGVNAAIESMLDVIIVSYTAYELFLLKWGIAELVTTRKPADIERKLDKVKALVKAKSNKEGLPITDQLREEVEEYLKVKEVIE